jgi:hypothetical protein
VVEDRLDQLDRNVRVNVTLLQFTLVEGYQFEVKQKADVGWLLVLWGMWLYSNGINFRRPVVQKPFHGRT